MDGTAGKVKLNAQCFFKNSTTGKVLVHFFQGIVWPFEFGSLTRVSVIINWRPGKFFSTGKVYLKFFN